MAILPDLGIPADLVRTAKPNGASTPKAAKTKEPAAPPTPETVTLTRDELMALLAKAKAEGAPTGEKRLWLKVSEKGALSLYGLQRFPVTLYAEQWERLVDAVPAIRAFMGENKAKLTRRA